MANDISIIRNIINVNYAGEYGAIRLYRSHIFIAKLFYKDLVDTLKKIQYDEKHHCMLFRNIMPEYNMRPCKLTLIWGAAAYLLGIATALMGRRSLLLCVKAAEETAHAHLSSQIVFLKNIDPKLADTIHRIDIEEQKHVLFSKQLLADRKISKYEMYLYKIIENTCQLTMWLVTKGKSSELKKFLKSNE